MQTLQHIPLWVFALLIGLIALGLQQTRTRHIRWQRLVGLQVGLTAVTLVGVAQQWRHTPWLALGLFCWAAACLLTSWALARQAAPKGARYDAETRRFAVPGSIWPLVLFMAIFVCKFAVGMVNATAPEALQTCGAAMGISALYGCFSGVLNGRAWRMLKLKVTP